MGDTIIEAGTEDQVEALPGYTEASDGGTTLPLQGMFGLFRNGVFVEIVIGAGVAAADVCRLHITY